MGHLSQWGDPRLCHQSVVIAPSNPSVRQALQMALEQQDVVLVLVWNSLRDVADDDDGSGALRNFGMRQISQISMAVVWKDK